MYRLDPQVTLCCHGSRELKGRQRDRCNIRVWESMFQGEGGGLVPLTEGALCTHGVSFLHKHKGIHKGTPTCQTLPHPHTCDTLCLRLSPFNALNLPAASASSASSLKSREMRSATRGWRTFTATGSREPSAARRVARCTCVLQGLGCGAGAKRARRRGGAHGSEEV